MSPEEMMKNKKENLRVFDEKVAEIVKLIDEKNNEYWAEKFPEQPSDHPLKSVLKAAFVVEIQNQICDELAKRGRQ